MFKSHKFKKSLIVYKDLKEFDFKFDVIDHKLYTLIHPEKKYSIWVASGIWFCSLYEVKGRNVKFTSVSKFGAVGKILVWWGCRKHISHFRKEVKHQKQKRELELFESISK